MSNISIPGVIAAAFTLYFTGGNYAAAVFAYSLASGIEAYVNAPNIEGPRLEDRKIQLSTYGAQIPIVFGSVRIAGNVIWPANFEVEEHSETEGGGSGGSETTTYTYSATFALLLCEGPIEGIGRIWMNKKLMYDPGAIKTTDPAIVGMTVYLGTEDQEPDPLMVAQDGSAPAYRGWAYIVFEDLELTNSGFGNRPPSVEVEIFTEATFSGPPEPRAVDLGISETVPSNYSPIATIDIGTNWIWAAQPNGSYTSTVHVTVVSDVGEVVIANFDELHPSGTTFTVGSIAALPEQEEVWVLVRSWPIPDRRALIARFYSGKSTAGGLVLVAPTFIGWVRIPTLIDAGNMIYDPGTGWLWIAYNFTYSAPITLGVIITIDQTVRSSLATGIIIGYPSSMAVGYPYLGIVGTLGPGSPSPNFMCVDAGLVNVIYSIRLPITPSQSKKAIDYDPERQRFIIIASTGFSYCLVDALSGTASTYTIAASANADTSPAPNASGISSVTYLPISDKYIFGANSGASNGSTLFVVNAATLVVENTYTYESGTNELLNVLMPPGDPAVGNYVIGFDPTHAKRLMLGGDVAGGPVSLASIVSSLCTRVPFGLDVADIDVTALTDLVDGYLVGQQMTRRSAIEPLMASHFFAGVESDHVMKYVKLGGASVVTIPQDDRAAHVDGEETPAHLNIIRVSELELPWTIDVTYQDKARDYEPGTQYERRITRNANDPRRIELPIVMTAEKAKQVALVNLYLPWLRTRFAFSTGVAYAKYEPTDVVTLPTDDVTYVARITRRADQGNGVLQWEAELEDSAIYTQTGTVAATYYVPQTIRDPGVTDLQLLDMPILRDVDNDPGYYVAMGGSTDVWPGAQLLKSTDNGASYAAMLSIVNEATIGTASGVLGNFTAGNIFDEGNSVTVVLSAGGPLVSATADQVLNGSNTAVIGAHGRWEVINFKTATLTATDTYLLSGLLRGRRGTEWATGTHVAGDTFVLASLSTWQRPNPGSAEIGLARLYKAPPFGTQLSAAVAESFTNSAVGLEPYAPVDLAGTRDGSNNLTITWHRRARYGYGALHTIVGLGEATESYSTDIMNGATVKRTIASATQTAAYTYAQQVTDFGFAQSSVTVNVYQISATVARGYALNGTI